MSLETCNNCGKRVMPSGGICPSCRQPFSAAPPNPFADQAPAVNPYSAPTAAAHAPAHADPIFIPALILLVLWILWTLYVFSVIALVASPTGPFEDFGEIRNMMLTSYVLMSVVNVISVAGAVAMLRRGPKWLAWTGAVLGLVPIMGPCFGLTLPIAIWVIGLLRRPDVSVQFSK